MTIDRADPSKPESGYPNKEEEPALLHQSSLFSLTIPSTSPPSNPLLPILHFLPFLYHSSLLSSHPPSTLIALLLSCFPLHLPISHFYTIFTPFHLSCIPNATSMCFSLHFPTPITFLSFCHFLSVLFILSLHISDFDPTTYAVPASFLLSFLSSPVLLPRISFILTGSRSPRTHCRRGI